MQYQEKTRRLGTLRAAAALGFVALVAPLLLATPAAASDASVRPVASVFFIAKSENRNQVHYGVRTDAACHPVADHPVYGYWRDLEEGPTVTSELSWLERKGYGPSDEQRVRTADHGGRVSFRVRGLPERTIVIETFETDAGCQARALTRIDDHDAVLDTVFLKLRLLGVEYAKLSGHDAASGSPLSERLAKERRGRYR